MFVVSHINILLILSAFMQEGVTRIQKVKILFVNEDTNHIAERSVQVAMQYIKTHPNLDVQVDMQTVTGSKNNSANLLKSICNTYKEMVTSQSSPHVVLDTTTFGLASETVKYFTASLALPTVSGSFGQEGDLRNWRNITEEDKKYLIQIMPPADVVTDIVKAFIMTERITNAAILYDSHYVMDHKLRTLIRNISTRHLIVAVNVINIQMQLINLKNQDISNFFIFGDINTINYVLDGAAKIQFLTKKNTWHIISLSNEELKCNCTNATVLYGKPELNTTKRLELLKNTYNFHVEPAITSAFYFDLALFAVLAVRDMLNKNAWPQDMHYLTCDDYNQSNIQRRNLNLKTYFGNTLSESPTFGPFNIKENGWSQMEFNMEISAVKLGNNVVDTVTNLTIWSAKHENNFTLSDPKIIEPYINEKFYKVVTMEQKPFIYIDKGAPKGFRGYCIDLLEEIAKYCNFKYEIHVVDDGKFGDMNKNGKWDGMVRELIDGTADIALGSISVSAERENVIDFTVPFYEGVGITVLMKRPLSSRSLFKFLSVLDNEVWLCIMAAYCFTSIIMWIFDRYSPCSYQNNLKKYEYSDEKRLFTFKECLWFCMTSLTPQGGGEAPKSPSGRLIAATWWLFGFIIISSYTANLAAFLTVTRLDNPVTSLNELSKQYKVDYAPVNGSMAMTYFKRMARIEKTFYEIWEDMNLNFSLSPVERSKLSVWEYPISDKYTKMWQTMKKNGMPATHEEAVQRVRNSRSQSDGFAYIGDGIDIKYLALVNCDLEVIGDEFSKKPLAIGVQKNSPLKVLISNAILDMMVKRQLETLKQKWWTDNPEAQVCGQEGSLSEGISIRNIGGIFIIVFVGISCSCIVLLIQNWKNICSNNSTKISIQPKTRIAAEQYLRDNKSRVNPFYVSLAYAKFRNIREYRN